MKIVHCKECGTQYQLDDDADITEYKCSCGGELTYPDEEKKAPEYDIVKCEQCGAKYRIKSDESIIGHECEKCGGLLKYLDEEKNKELNNIPQKTKQEVAETKKAEDENLTFSQRILKNFNLGKSDRIPLAILAILSVILVAYYINFNSNIGIICSDVYVYLINALSYAGIDAHAQGTTELSPLICFLTSLFFDAGFINEFAIYIVTGVFAILGNIGYYLLLRQYFNENLSLTGAIICSTCTLYLTGLANGTIEIPAVSLMIWTMLFAVMAIEDNPKYYKYALVALVLAIFTQFSALLIVPALAFYYLLKKGFAMPKEDRKEILKGAGIGALLAIVIFAGLFSMGAMNSTADSQSTGEISGQDAIEADPAYNPNGTYYLENIPNFISNSHTEFEANPNLESPTPLSYLVLGIILVGGALWLYDNKTEPSKKDIFGAITLIIAIITFLHINPIITIFLSLVGLYYIGEDSENKTGYLMIAWILINFIFYSYNPIKVNRYILPAFPPLVYFLLVGINSINSHVKFDKRIIPMALIVLFVLQAFAFPFTFGQTDDYSATDDISQYIIDNNPDYEDLNIGAYDYRPYSWHLTQNVINLGDDKNEIAQSDVKYYIADHPIDSLSGYKDVYNAGKYHLYEKTS